MSDENPFTPPEANLKRTTMPAGTLLTEPATVPASHGWQWITAGFSLFKMSPVNWIVMAFLFALSMAVLSTIPVLSVLTNLISPIFSGGLLLACHQLAKGERINVNYLYAARQHFLKLMMVGVIYGSGALLLFIVLSMFVGAGMVPEAGADGAAALSAEQLVMFTLLSLIVMIPLMMAYFFAPALVVFHDIAPLDAMKLSYKASLRNIGAMTVFGLMSALLAFLAAIPVLLGFLVWIPVMVGASYTAYRQTLVSH